MRYFLTIMLSALALPAAGQDVEFTPTATEACLAETEGWHERHACIGRSAGACIEATPSGGSTAGMATCAEAERAYWDARLNAAYTDLLAQSEDQDANMAEIGATVPSLAEALRAMQRAWIPYRNAACDYELAQWGGGSGSGPATLACLMQLTGEQALALEGRLELR